ncbi:uncharacterized protein LOC117903221, partial [Drosophila subobscura]|uniref:uncharacterized protein LOC117903221 n=1 Tax=Drosophila subobscura TaxID=7241 RepID=UPI00155AC42D
TTDICRERRFVFVKIANLLNKTSLTASGEFQFVVQNKYNEQCIICHTKVSPSPVTCFGKKSYNYHWVTPAKWDLIESSLRDLLDMVGEQPVRKLHAEFHTGSIQMRVDSTKYEDSYSHDHLPGMTPLKDDLYLNMQLEYIDDMDSSSSSFSSPEASPTESDHEERKRRLNPRV